MNNISGENKFLVYKLCCIWGLMVGAWMILQITVPLILKEIVGKNIAPTWQGIFSATSAISGMVFCAVLGHHSDRLGRHGFFLSWAFAFFLSIIFVMYGEAAKVIYPLWVARTAAISIPGTIVHATLSDHLSGNALLEAFSYVSVAFGLSMFFSSIICGVIAKFFSRSLSLIFATFLSGMAMLLALDTKVFRAPPAKYSSLGTRDETETPCHPTNNLKNSIRIICNDALLRNLIIALSILRTGNVNTHMMLVLFTDYRLGWGLFEISFMSGGLAVLSCMIQIVGIRLIISSNLVLHFLFFILTLVPLIVAGYSFAMTGFQLFIVSVLNSLVPLGSIIFNSKIAALASENGISGFALGSVGTLQNMLEILVSLFLGGLMSWSFKNYPPTHVLSGAPFIANGVMLLFVVILVVFSHKRYGVGRVTWEMGSSAI